MPENQPSVEEQVEILLRGTLFADEVDGASEAGEKSLREQMREELTAKLNKGRPLRVYLGVDPTASSLHIGHLVPALKLRQFQILGHQAVFLIGDYTGRIGDPSGQVKERPQFTAEQLDEMGRGYADQAFRVLEQEGTEVRRNSEWLERLTFADVIRLAAIFPLKQILARREFQERMEAGKPLRFHETLYPLMQGYDAQALECDVQVGGYDQHFNLLAGRAIQQHFGQEPHVMITLPLLPGTDGRKMSKTYGNSIDVADTPRDMYGKVMRISDEMIPPYLNIACLLMQAEENSCLRDNFEQGAVNPIEIKEAIAHHVVSLYHDTPVADSEREWFRSHIRGRKLPDEIPEAEVTDALMAEPQWASLMAALELMGSKGEVRRLIKGGGFRVEGEQMRDLQGAYDGQDGVLVQYGKRKFIRLRRPGGAA